MLQLTSCIILNDETNAVVLLVSTMLDKQRHCVAKRRGGNHTHSSAVSMYLAVPSMVLQYSVANLVMSWSKVALWSSTGSP